MYYNHTLRTNLLEWTDRIAHTNYRQFENQLLFFINNIEKEKILFSIIQDSCIEYPYNDEEIKQMMGRINNPKFYSFAYQAKQVSFSYHYIKYLLNNHSGDIISSTFPESGTEAISDFVQEFILPITNYLHDKLNRSSSTIYLLEKYKKRTEWFNKNILFEKYKSADKEYEQIFEDDLRLFLFDQGIDYPFSTPKSTSGRADLIGAIDTSDPLIIEIKIFDRGKKYEINRIVKGLTQIKDYTNDYNKEFGYLVIFNLEEDVINFVFSENDKYFPPRLSIGNKTFYFVVVNIKPTKPASKKGQSKTIDITEDLLLKSINA